MEPKLGFVTQQDKGHPDTHLPMRSSSQELLLHTLVPQHMAEERGRVKEDVSLVKQRVHPGRWWPLAVGRCRLRVVLGGFRSLVESLPCHSNQNQL